MFCNFSVEVLNIFQISGFIPRNIFVARMGYLKILFSICFFAKCIWLSLIDLVPPGAIGQGRQETPGTGGCELGHKAVGHAADGAASGEHAGWSDSGRHCTGRAGPLSAGAGGSWGCWSCWTACGTSDENGHWCQLCSGSLLLPPHLGNILSPPPCNAGLEAFPWWFLPGTHRVRHVGARQTCVSTLVLLLPVWPSIGDFPSLSLALLIGNVRLLIPNLISMVDWIR